MWDKLKTRLYKQLAVLMYKTVNRSTPTNSTRIFEYVNTVHSYKLRDSDVPRTYTEAGQNSFHYQGAVLWNGLSNDVKSQVRLRSFKEFL